LCNVTSSGESMSKVFLMQACGRCKYETRYTRSMVGTQGVCPKCKNAITFGMSAPPPLPSSTGTSLVDVGKSVPVPAWAKNAKELANTLAPLSSTEARFSNSGGSGGSADPWAVDSDSPVKLGRFESAPQNSPWVKRSAIAAAILAVVGVLGVSSYVLINKDELFPPNKTVVVKDTNPDPTKGTSTNPPPDATKPPEDKKPDGGNDKNPNPPSSKEPVVEVANQGSGLDPKKTYAQQIVAENGCESIVYVSSLIGMADFDKKYLATLSREESHEMLQKDLVTSGTIENVAQGVKYLQVQSSLDSEKDSLWDHRPMFTVFFPDLQHDDIKVSVYVDVPLEAQKYLSVTKDQPVSMGTGILLSKETSKDKCDFNAEQNRFELPIDLHWNLDALRNLEVDLTLSLNIRVEYEGDKSIDPFPVKITLKPAEQIERGYPLAINFATLIDSQHPWIKKLINDIPKHKKWSNNEILLVGGGGDDFNRVMSAFMIWEELVARKISYQSFTGGDFKSQRARRVNETLETRNGNCADGSVLFASFFEAIGLKPALVFGPQHVFIAIRLSSGIFYPIETTDIGFSVSPDEYKKIPLDLILEEMIQKYKWLEKEPAFRSFAKAVDSGRATYKEWDDALAVLGNDLGAANGEIEVLEEELNKLTKQLEDPNGGGQSDEIKKQIDKVTTMIMESQKMKSDVLHDIQNAAQIQMILQLRSLGINPVGTPQNWEQNHKLPPRPTSQ